MLPGASWRWLAGGYGLARLWFVVLPVFVALLICAFLVPAVTWLERRRWPPLAATWSVFGGFLAGVVAVGLLVVPAVAEEFAGLVRFEEGADCPQIQTPPAAPSFTAVVTGTPPAAALPGALSGPDRYHYGVRVLVEVDPLHDRPLYTEPTLP